MNSFVLVTREPLERARALLEEPWRGLAATPPVSGGRSGACLDFQGIVRGWEDAEGEARAPAEAGSSGGTRAPANSPAPAETPAGPVPIAALEYEAHEEMARHQMEKILARLAETHPLEAAVVIHRIGRVEVGEASLWVRLFAPHRGEALRACAEFIDELKKLVPIWKHPLPPADPGHWPRPR